MAAIRYEVWTRPESGTFVRKFPLRGEMSASFSTDLFGRAVLVLPVNHPRLDDILVIDQANRANDAASVIRAYIGTTPIFDFYVESLELNFTDTGLRTATAVGSARGTCFDRVRVRQYDWNVKPSIDPDWEYGIGGRNGIVDPGFEEWDLNGGAETGEIVPWTDTPSDSIFTVPAVSLTVQSTDVLTGTYAFEIDPSAPHSGMQYTVPVQGGGQYVFSARLKDPAASGDRYTMYIEMGDGSTLNVGAAVWSGYGVAELDGAAYRAGVSDGTWQNLDATVTFGPDVTETTISVIYDDHVGGSGGLFRVDDIAVSGPGLGLDPWESVGTWDVYELDSTVSRSEANSLKFKAGAASTINTSGVRQRLTDMIVGKTYTYGAWFQHDGAGNEPVVMVAKRPSGAWAASKTTQIPTGVVNWTFAYVTFVADTTEIWLDWRYGAAGASPNMWMDDATSTNSLPAAPVGKILNDLLDDAAIDHAADSRTALAWLPRTFTDTHDSSGALWDQDIDIRIRRGSTYRWMIETMERMGYEFSIDVNPADETEWRFNAYNSGNMGTDHTAGDGPAILSRPGLMAAGPFLRREPVASYTMVEGDNFYWDEYRDTAIETVWGEIETYIGSQDSLSGVLLKQATEVVTSDGGESLILSFAGHLLTAGIDYDVGDTIRVTLGDAYYPSAKFRVAAISVSDDEVEPQFQVEFQPV